MFKIIDYRYDSGKIIMTIETNDQLTADFLRFFGAANKFVELFHFRMRMEKGIDLYQKTKPLKMAQANERNAAQLERFRQLSGTRIDKLRILKEERLSRGEKVTLDDIDAPVRLGIVNEKKLRLEQMLQLRSEGKTVKDIAILLAMPISSVARIIRNNVPGGPPENRSSTQIVTSRRRSGLKNA